MRTERKRTSDDGIRLGGSDDLDEDETLIDEPPPNEFAGLDDEGDSSPSDRRRDPLRHKL